VRELFLFIMIHVSCVQSSSADICQDINELQTGMSPILHPEQQHHTFPQRMLRENACNTCVTHISSAYKEA